MDSIAYDKYGIVEDNSDIREVWLEFQQEKADEAEYEALKARKKSNADSRYTLAEIAGAPIVETKKREK